MQDHRAPPLFQDEPPHAGPSHARPLQAGPPQPGSSEAPPELSGFRMRDGHLAKDYWVFTGQTATGAQIDMLERSGVKRSEAEPGPPSNNLYPPLGVASYGRMERGELHSSHALARSGPLA